MKLYRFEKAEDKRINTLRARGFWCSSPRTFNDPSDCRLEIALDLSPSIISKEMLASINRSKLDQTFGKDLIDRLLKLIYTRHEGKEIEHLLEKILDMNLISDRVIDTIAVCCFFASTPRNALMWSHYGDGHRGYCVEYEIDESKDDDKKNLVEVTYLSKLPVISPEEFIFSTATALSRIVTSKSLIWAYEHEYRFVQIDAFKTSHKFGRFVGLPANMAPKRIICGMRQSDDDYAKLDEVAKELKIPIAKLVINQGALILEEERVGILPEFVDDILSA